MADTTKQYGIIPARLNWDAVDFDLPINQIPEEHRALYIRAYSDRFPEDYGSMRQRFNGAIVPANGKIYAIGKTAEEAIVNFWLSRGVAREHIEIGDEIGRGDPNFFDWGYRVVIGEEGTGCKASGMYVPGGAVMTWWK